MLKELKFYPVLIVCVLSMLFSVPWLESKSTICLNMIVKNESAVITRCLSSVLPIIDTWVIVDTGSTDGTQELIKEFMKSKGKPGELHERPWKNFSHNRNEALELAKGKSDYVFFIDADEYLSYEPDFKLPDLTKDYYYITISHSGSTYGRIQLVNTRKEWKYAGVLHEVICPPAGSTYATLENVKNIYTTEGFRSRDPEKYLKDAKILEEALKEEPNNGRYVFYLAQSYKDAGKDELALKYYEKHVTMPAWDQEIFWSYLQIAILQENLNQPDDKVTNSYLKAWQFRRTRMEPLYYMIFRFRQKGDYQSGYQLAKIAQKIPPPQDLLFVQKWMYDYGLALEQSICAYWIGEYEESRQLCLDLLKKKDLPEDFVRYAETNLKFANEKIAELQSQRK